MVSSVIFKCILLAKFHVDVVEVPVNEYAMASISKIYNGVQFSADVLEGRLNSIAIEFPETGSKTMSYSFKDSEQRSLSTTLDTKDEHASMDCEII